MTRRYAWEVHNSGSPPEPKAGLGRRVPARGPVVETGALVSTDPYDTEAAWRPWNLCVTVDEPGTYGYRRHCLKTPGVTLVLEAFDAPCRLRGLAMPDSLVLALPLRVGPGSRYWGKRVSPDRLLAMRSSAVNWIVDRGQSHLILVGAGSLIRRHGGVDLQVALERAASAHYLPLKPNAVDPLGAKMLGLIAQGARVREDWLPMAVASMEEELIQQLVEAIDAPRLLKTKPDTSSRRAGTERALEYLRGANLSAVKPHDLAEVAGVSVRRLENGCRDLFDLTPLALLHLLRLHATRRALIAPNGDRRTIREIAEQWGFPEHGRFSGYYRAAFGELPSETRERRGACAGGKPPRHSRIQPKESERSQPIPGLDSHDESTPEP